MWKRNQTKCFRVDSNDRVSNSFNPNKIPYESYDAVVVADYDKGFLTYKDIQTIGEQLNYLLLIQKR